MTRSACHWSKRPPEGGVLLEPEEERLFLPLAVHRRARVDFHCGTDVEGGGTVELADSSWMACLDEKSVDCQNFFRQCWVNSQGIKQDKEQKHAAG
jgi:hypothetical protein